MAQRPAPKLVSDHRETPALTIRKTEALPLELRLQNTILFAQESDYVVLLSLEPAEERRQQEVERDHGASLSQQSGGVFGHYDSGQSTRASRSQRTGRLRP